MDILTPEEQAFQDLLNKLAEEQNIKIITKQRDTPNKSEFWPPNEPGTPDYARPQEIPLTQSGVEINSPDVKARDVVGDIASHQMVNNDPNMTGYYREFERSLTPDQHNVLKEQYNYAQKNEGETRSYDDWYKAAGLPSYFRGYPFKQWDDASNKELYNQPQRNELDNMIKYLETGKPPSDKVYPHVPADITIPDTTKSRVESPTPEIPGIKVDYSPTESLGELEDNYKTTIPPRDRMKDEPLDLSRIPEDKLVGEGDPDQYVVQPSSTPGSEVTEFNPDAFRRVLEGNATLSKATDDGSLDYAPIKVQALGPLDLINPIRMEQAAKDLHKYFSDPLTKMEVDARAQIKPVRLMNDFELQAIMDDESNPNYNNAWNERSMRDRWQKQTFYENQRDVDFVKRQEERVVDQMNSSLARIPGQAATLAGMAIALPEHGLKYLGAEGPSPTQGALELGAEWNAFIDKVYRTSPPETSIETAAGILGGVIPVGGAVKGALTIPELLTPLTFGMSPGRVAANFGVQFLGAEALRPAFAPEGDRYETIFQSFFKTDPAIAQETGQENSPLERDWIIARRPDGIKIRNSDLDKLGMLGVVSIGLGFAPRVIDGISNRAIPMGRYVDPTGYQAPKNLKTFETSGTLLRTYLVDPITSGMWSLARRVGVNNDNLYHAIEVNTQAAQHEKIKNALNTGIARTLGGDYNSPVPANRVAELASALAPAKRALANSYIILQDTLKQMKAAGISRVNQAGVSATINVVRRQIADIEKAFPEVKDLHTMYNKVWDANKQFAGRFARDFAVKDINDVAKLDIFDTLLHETQNAIKKKMDNTNTMRLIEAFRETPNGSSMFVRATKKIKAQFKNKPQWAARVVKYWDDAGKKHEFITTHYLKDILELDPYYARSALLYGTGRMFQWGTTSYGAPWFALKQFFREAELGNQFAPVGFRKTSHIGPTVEINGHQIGVAIPGMNYMRGTVALFEQVMRKSQRVLAENIYKVLDSSNGGPAIVKHVFGEKGLRALADLASNSYLKSVYHIWTSSGGQGVGMNKGAILEGNRKINAYLANLRAYGSKIPGIDSLMLDKLYRTYKSLLDSMHNNGNWTFFGVNYRSLSKAGKMNDKKLDQLLAESRKLTADLSVSGRVFKGTGRKIDVELGADAPLGEVIDKSIYRATGSAIDLAQQSSPWFNALVQGMRRLGIMYYQNPWRFQARLYAGLTMPMTLSYFTAYVLGPEYTDYMMVGRDERQKATELYIPIPGKPPEEGIGIPMPLELAPLVYMQLNVLDSFFRDGGGPTNWTIAKTILENFADLTTPPILTAGAGLAGVKMPGTAFFGGGGYSPQENLNTPLPSNYELALRALGGSTTDIFLSGLQATMDGDDVNAGLHEMEYKFINKFPVIQKHSLSTFNDLSEQEFAFERKLTQIEKIWDQYLDPNMIGKIKKDPSDPIIGYGENLDLFPNQVEKLNKSGSVSMKGGKPVLVPDESGGKETILPGASNYRAGLPTVPPPTNPVYIQYASTIHEAFEKQSGNFKKSTQRLEFLQGNIKTLQQVNSGNLRKWKDHVDNEMPDTMLDGTPNLDKQYLKSLDLNDRDSVRKAMNYFHKERTKTIQTINVLVKEVEDKVTSDMIAKGTPLKRPLKLMDLDPYSSGSELVGPPETSGSP